ncbi:unnamed protein product [Effrenium voratum]|uniref:K Homology domain-containing protein n=1 Tax=Effrenium voratum TaxID=2562239 RepID=A0AA36IJU4_9DINO|nr:unnamed protein product [Effrenium voratum]CAJ1439363.1 unnamed protein product [Effrenium voratum]
MSSGLLADYDSDAEPEDPLKDGYEARQAIARQFLCEDFDEPSALGEESEVAAGGEPEEPDEPEEGEDEDIDLGMCIDVEPAAQPESGMHALDSNELAAAILEAELDDDEEKLESLRAELAERQAREARGEAPGAMVSKVSITDSVEVPVQVIGAVIGSGGAVIKQLAAQSGARMSFAQEDYQPGYLALTRRCLISGATDVVEKAKALLQEVVSSAMADQDRGGRKGKGKGKGQRKGTPTNLSSDLLGEGAGGRAGFQAGICKWYAAGFCRNRPDASGGCRNGLHSTDAALKAEADWVAQGPSGGVQPSRPLLLLLDLEGGGNKDGRDGEDEIIEVPILSMCSSTGKECGRFHRFARPGYWTREEWSMRNRFHAGCFNNGANSVPFPEVVHAIQNWLRDLLQLAPGKELRSEDFLFVTCGNWDVKSAIPRQCSNPVPGTVDYSLQQLLFSRWSNLKEVYRDFYKLPDSAAPTGMRGMLKLMRIPLSGQHHLGMDDVSNLAKILQRLIHEGCKVEPTGHKAPVGLPMNGKKGKGKGKDKGKDKGKGKEGKEGKDRGKDKGKDEGYGVNGPDMHGHGPGNGWGKAEGGKGEDVRAERSEEGKKGEADKGEEGEGKGEEGKQKKMREDEEGDGGEELEEDAGPPPLKAPRILNPPVMLPAPTGSLAEPPRIDPAMLPEPTGSPEAPRISSLLGTLPAPTGPPLKAARISSLLATLPAPKARSDADELMNPQLHGSKTGP